MGIFSTTKPAASVTSGEPGPLVKLFPQADLGEFYALSTGCTPDPNYFGVYAIEPVGDTLYLGFGTARPAEARGALLVKTDGQLLTAVCEPSEQGFVGMRYGGDTLYVPGADPLEDWTLGNVYVGCPPDKIVKHRNLPNVVHTWAVYPHPAGRLYAAVGQHAGDSQTFYGGVFVSEDKGSSWSAVPDRNHVLGIYRTYDITSFGDKLYAIANDDYQGASLLAVSSDSGATWKRIPAQIESRPRLFASRDSLVALSWGRDALQLVSANGRVTRARFRNFRAAEWAYNYICAGYGGWYYMLADGGRIYNSRDLKTWTLVAVTGLNLLAVSYWQTRNWLILADRGSGASLYRLDLALRGAV